MPKQRFIIKIEVEAGENYLAWLESNLHKIAENQLTDDTADPYIPWDQLPHQAWLDGVTIDVASVVPIRPDWKEPSPPTPFSAWLRQAIKETENAPASDDRGGEGGL